MVTGETPVISQPVISLKETESVLRNLVLSFTGLPLENGRMMRELLEQSRDVFRIAALNVFRDLPQERGSRYIVTLLWVHDLLIPILADMTTPRQICLDLARTASQVDSVLNTRLSSYLEEEILENPDLSAEVATRFLELLSATTDSAGIEPLLRRILLHPNARIRSKATVLSGRGPSGIRMIEKLSSDEDPRVRANAVEALWYCPLPRAVSLFLASLPDANNRVVGNAILGLYFARSTKSIPATIELAAHPDPIFRSTAAWVMSKTEDPRFRPYLGKLLGESSGQVRKIVFNALEALKRSASLRDRSRYTARIFGAFQDASGLRVQVGITETGSGEPVDVPPTGFLLSVGPEPTIDFTVETETNSRLTVGVALPRLQDRSNVLTPEFVVAVKRLIEIKPALDSWHIVQYSPASTQKSLASFRFLGQETSEAAPPRPTTPALSAFTTDALFLTGELTTGKLRSELHADVFDAMGVLLRGTYPRLGSRHQIVLADGSEILDPEDERALIGGARAAQVSLHVFSPHESVQLRHICAATSGVFQIVDKPETIGRDLDFLYKSLRHRYLIECPQLDLRNTTEDSISIQVHNREGSAECTLPTSQVTRTFPSE